MAEKFFHEIKYHSSNKNTGNAFKRNYMNKI